MLQDAAVGLVEDKFIHVLQRQPSPVQHLIHAPGYGLHGKPEHRRSLHIQHRLGSPVDPRPVENIPGPPGPQHRGHGGIGLPILHHRGGRPVPEEDAGAPVGVVGDAGEHLGADHQAVFPGAGRQQGLGGVQAVDKAGAGGIQIEAHRVLRQTQPVLQHAGSGGGDVVGGDGGDQADPYGLRTDSGHLHGRPGGGLGQAALGLVPAFPPLPDAGAADDPGVVGLHDPLQIPVGDHLPGQGAARALEPDSAHARSFFPAGSPMARNF